MRAIATILLLTAPRFAAAEISDKVQTAPDILLTGAAVAVLAFLLSRWRWWLSAVGVVLAIVIVVGATDLLGISGLRDALWNEMPAGYFAAIAGAAGMVIVGAAIGGIRGWRKRDV